MREAFPVSRDPARKPSASALELEVADLLRRGEDHAALALAMRGGADEFAAATLARASLGIVRASGDFGLFFEAVERLGPALVSRWPELDAAAVWALALSGRLRLAAMRLDDLEQRIPALLAEGRSFLLEYPRTPFDRNDPQTGMHSWARMMRVLIASFSGASEQALRLAAEWVESFPRATEYDLAAVRCATGMAKCMLGRFREAESDGVAALATFQDERIRSGVAWAAVCVIVARTLDGRVDEAGQLLDDLDHAGSTTAETEASMRSARTLVLFERGEVRLAVDRAGSHSGRSGEPRAVSFIFSDLMVGVRGLLALGRQAEAVTLLQSVHYRPEPEAAAWWHKRLTLERARTAMITGELSLLEGPAPDDVRLLIELIADCCRRPTAVLLRPLRVLAQQAEESRAGDAWAIFQFLKARVEHDTGNELQARRTVTQLLVSPLQRQRVGSLASLARGLPVFGAALKALLDDPSGPGDEPRRLAAVLGQLPAAAPQAGVAAKLSKRERQMAAALFEGLSNRDIAGRLHLTEQTVKWHLWNLFQKLGVRNRLGAVNALRQQGYGSEV